jgi:hypothetical protein
VTPREPWSSWTRALAIFQGLGMKLWAEKTLARKLDSR